MERINFLETIEDDEDVRHELLKQQAINILDSYHHEWDVLSELLQNAIDAIEENKAISKGVVEIVFDAEQHKISVEDNGIGIAADELAQVLRPGRTLKAAKASLRGEKGVGLSFLVFSTNSLVVESVNATTKVIGEVQNAFDWVSGKIDEVPTLELEKETVKSKPSFSRITLSGVASLDDAHNLFSYSIGRLKYILRTRTSVGNTASLFEEAPKKPIAISLTFTDSNGKSTSTRLDYSYDGPGNYIKPSIRFTERIEKLKVNQKESVKGRPVYNFGEFKSQTGRTIKYYYFACSRHKFSDMSKTILDGSEGDRDLVRGGIFLSTKCMPTGVHIAPPSKGKEGYWSNIYIMFEYDDLRLDQGRKSVPGRIVHMLRSQAEKIYDELSPHFEDILDTDYEIESELEQAATIDEMWDWLEDNVDDLGLKNLAYVKEPHSEQSVVALFYEMIGRQILNGYETWRNSSKDTYDAYIKYRYEKDGKPKLSKIIAEFKQEGCDVINDMKNHVKEYTKINLLICWTLNVRKFEENGFTVRTFNDVDRRFFNGSTHEIRQHVGSPIQVICLKTIVDKMRYDSAQADRKM
ncbi:MAG: ATP-binding protein [Acidobacteria bacterium]|nr:ATP-binding protein [Acidobacteriota bacterium]